MSSNTPLDPVLRAARALCFVEVLEDPVVSDEDAHHLRDVLRLRAGETIALSDGAGRWRAAELAGEHRGRARSLEFDHFGEIAETAPAPYETTVAFALPKGERAEWAVQKLTEVGVDQIVPLLTERTVVRLDAAERSRRAERLRRVAREAASQSRRTRLPVLVEPCSLHELRALGELLLAEPGGRAVTSGDKALAIGPEGGFSPRELDLATATIDLGPTVLRTETAAIAGAVLLAAARSLGVREEASPPSTIRGATL